MCIYMCVVGLGMCIHLWIFAQVPILTVNGVQLNDSDAIIATLNAYLVRQGDPNA